MPGAVRLLWVSLAAAIAASGAGAQEAHGPLVPRGALRFAVSTDYSSFWARYRPGPGGERGDGQPVSLGDDFSGPAGTRLLPSLAGYEAAVARAAGEEHPLRLGALSTAAEKNSVRLALSADVGALDWLTVGVTAPLVRNETEFSMHFAADSALANAGAGPAPGAASAFLSGFGGAVGEFRDFRTAACAADPNSAACAEATTRLAQAEQLQDALATIYRAPVAPLAGSAPGAAIQARLAALAEAFRAAGVASLPATAPLASSPLDAEGFQRLVTDPGLGIAASHPLAQWTSLWALGDIEVRADARLWESGDANAASHAEAGIGLTARLPTGARDDPANFLDEPTGDAQTDVVFRGWANARWRARFGIWADLRYGLQLAGTTERRVFDPYFPVAPAHVQRALRWNPGDYQMAAATPWLRLADGLTLLAGYQYFRKGEDAFSLLAEEDAAADPPDASVLAYGSAATSSRFHAGGIFRRPRAPSGSPLWPTEIRAVYRRVATGAGIVPKTGTLEVRLRFETRLWGSGRRPASGGVP